MSDSAVIADVPVCVIGAGVMNRVRAVLDELQIAPVVA